MRIIRQNPDRNENAGPLASDCVAHRCAEHAEMGLMDDSADDNSECAICLAHKFVQAYEKAAEAEILKRLVWPMVQSCRDRLNLLAAGAGDQFEESAREQIVKFTEEIE